MDRQNGTGMLAARRGVGWLSTIVAILLVVAVGGCSGDEPGRQSMSRDPATMSVQETADALSAPDPKTRQLGVWSVLRHLGVGVYKVDGTEVLRGAAPGEDGVFVFDTQVDVLADMATTEREVLLALAARIQRLGVARSPAQILESYRSAYAAAPNAWLVQLLTARGMNIADGAATGPRVDALAEWLLLLDGFLAPPSSTPAPAGAAFILEHRAARDGEIQTWGLAHEAAGGELGLAAMKGILQAQLMWQGVRVTVEPALVALDQGRGGPGTSVKVVARVDAAGTQALLLGTFGPDPLLHLVTPNPAGIALEWDRTPDIVGHTTIQSGQNDGTVHWSITDPGGRAEMTLQAVPDPGRPEDPAQHAAGTLTVAPIDIVGLFHAVFSGVDDALAGFLVEQPRPRGTLPVTVAWHEKRDCKVFSDGVWTGSAPVKGTVSTGAGTSMSATGGSIDFQIAVSGGKVVDGTVTQNTDVEGQVAGTHATGHIVARGVAGGTGDAVTITWQTGTITLAIDGLPSQQLPVSAGNGSFAPTSGDCTTLTGDIFAYDRTAQNTNPGMTSTITGVFTARRS